MKFLEEMLLSTQPSTLQGTEHKKRNNIDVAVNVFLIHIEQWETIEADPLLPPLQHHIHDEEVVTLVVLNMNLTVLIMLYLMNLILTGLKTTNQLS